VHQWVGSASHDERGTIGRDWATEGWKFHLVLMIGKNGGREGSKQSPGNEGRQHRASAAAIDGDKDCWQGGQGLSMWKYKSEPVFFIGIKQLLIGECAGSRRVSGWRLLNWLMPLNNGGMVHSRYVKCASVLPHSH